MVDHDEESTMHPKSPPKKARTLLEFTYGILKATASATSSAIKTANDNIASMERDDDDDDEDEDEVSSAEQAASSKNQTADAQGTPAQTRASKRRMRRKVMNIIKASILLIVWGVFTFFLIVVHEKKTDEEYIAIEEKQPFEQLLDVKETKSVAMGVTLTGPFLAEEFEMKNRHARATTIPTLQLQFERVWFDENGNISTTKAVSSIWELHIVKVADLPDARYRTMSHVLKLDPYEEESDKNTRLRLLIIMSDFAQVLPLKIVLDGAPVDKAMGTIYAFAILIFLYGMIIWDIVDRTFAAILASTTAIGVLSWLGDRPDLRTIASWVDYETLMLLFSMMILMAVLSETGLFDYLAVFAYKITYGGVWPMLTCLCLFTAVLSAFLDNVTMVLLITPITIRLCEMLNLHVTKVLISIVVFSNIGGTLTAVGDPPNVIIVSNPQIAESGVNFFTFFIHMMPVTSSILILTYLQFRIWYRHPTSLMYDPESQKSDEQKRALSIWKKAAAGVTPLSQTEGEVREEIMKTVKAIRGDIRKSKQKKSTPTRIPPNYEETLALLEAKYPIKHRLLLWKCAVSMIFVITLFFLHAVPMFDNVSLPWAALLGVILLLILANNQDMSIIVKHVEWDTLVFFAVLFVLMESLAELGLIDFIGKLAVKVILDVEPESQLIVAILIILWLTGITSAFVDNIPITTMMIKVIIELGENQSLKLPIVPLIWSLALGACLGGNGTLIGASANVVCAGIAAQHGFKFTFMDFFKIGFPVMLTSLIYATIYLYIAHGIIEWH